MEMLHDKYKRLFGIDGSLIEFDPVELKRRWRHLCHKYHPDTGGELGNADHFRFVQDAYKFLKKKCKGISIKDEEKFIDELYGIREIKGDDFCIWDIGEADWKKRHEWIKKHGKGPVVINKKRSYGYV
jgi:hypothetical protein